MTTEFTKTICLQLWELEKENSLQLAITAREISGDNLPKLLATIQKLAFCHGVASHMNKMEQDKQMQHDWMRIVQEPPV